VWTILVLISVDVILAPAMAAPEASVTVPTMVPWENAALESSGASENIR
jgi:hypothetical protein